MQFVRLPSFKRAYKALPQDCQQRIDKAVERFAQVLESKQLSAGLGLKQLRHGFWEIRAGLSERIVFRRIGDTIEFVVCGSHETIKRFLNPDSAVGRVGTRRKRS